MIKVLGWTSTILVAGFLVWQLAVGDPIFPRILSAVLLVIISCLAGIRIGTVGAVSYITDVQRLNKILAEQHQELEELNATLLKQVNAEVETPASSERI